MSARWIIAYATAAVVAVAGIGFDVYRHHERTDAQRHTAGPSLVDASFAVTVTTPSNATLVQGGTQSFEVEAQAPRGVKTIELWDGNHRIDAQPGEPSTAGHTGESVASFSYPALDVGPHLLYARVIDASGAVSISAISNVDVDQPRIGKLISGPKGAKSPSGPIAARIPVRPGETAASIAARLAVSPADVTIIDGSALIATHPLTAQPMTGDQLETDPAPTTAVSGESGALAALASGCGVNLSGGAAGATLAEASANGPGFIKIGHLDSHGAASIAALTPGRHVLLAHTGRGDSLPISMLVPQSCALKLGWTGDITLIDGILTLNQNYHNAYLYLQDGAGRPYLRFPASQDQYLPDGLRRINLGSKAQVFGDKTVRVEVWSQQGRTAKKVAEGSYVHTGPPPPTDVTFPPAPITLMPDAINVGPDPQDAVVIEQASQAPFNLLWRTDNPSVTRVKWQLTLHPDPNVGDGQPADTVYEGLSSPGPMVNGVESGTFTVDPKAVMGLLPGSEEPAGSIQSVLQDELRAGGGQVYVRVIGFGRGSNPGPPISTYLGLISNSVSVTLLSPDQQRDQFKVTSLTLDNGPYPNPAYAECVVVSNIHWTPDQVATATADAESHLPKSSTIDNLVLLYHDNGRYCFGPPSNDCGFFCAVGQFFGALLSGLEDAWDFIANTFNGLIDKLSDLVAELNPICAIISAAGSSNGDKDCKAITDIAAHAAIGAVLAAYGIPPSLPTSAQIGQIASGDLTVLAETYLEELGIPCGDATVSGAQATALADASAAAGLDVKPDADGTIDPCKAALEALLGEIQGAVAQKAQDDVATEDYATPCPVDLCTIEQDPAGYIQPPLIHIKAVRVGGVVKPGETVPLDVSFVSSDPDHYPPTYLGGLVNLVSADGSTIDETIAFTTPGPYGRVGVTPLNPITITANLGLVSSVHGPPTAYLNGTTSATAGFDPMAP